MNSVSSPTESNVLLPEAAAAGSAPIPVDRINELYRGEIFTEESARIARDRIHWMCAQVEGDLVLDVGCSQGITAILLAREGCVVTAIDTHPESVAFARDELTRETPLVQGRVRLIETDLISLPEEPSFDTIVMGEVLEHQALPERFLRAGMMRLRPGGRLVITTPFALHPHPDHKISLFPSHIESLARRLGLAVSFLDVADHYIRAVLTRTAGERAGETTDLLRMTERATLESQQRLFDRLDERGEQLKKKTDALRITQRKMAEAVAALETERKEASRRAEQLQARGAETQKARELAETRVQQLQTELAARQADVTRATADLERHRQEHEELMRASAALREQHEALNARHAEEVATLRNAASDVRHVQQQRLAVEEALRQARAASEREAAGYRQRIAALEGATQALRRSTPHRLGQALVSGLRSGRGLRALPGELWGLGREVLLRRKQHGAKALSEEERQALLRLARQSGVEAVRARVEADRVIVSHRAAAFGQLSRELRGELPAASAELARLAYAADPQPFRAKWLAFRLYDAGAIAEPVNLLLGCTAELSASELKRADEVRSLHLLQQQLPSWIERSGPAYVAHPDSLMYVSATCLPYHTSGYSNRSHELLQSLAAVGLRVHALTRPGYPWDRQDRRHDAAAAATAVDAVTYHHLRQPNVGMPLDVYLREAAEAIKKVALQTKVGCIHAASNHVNALPALIAARELGLPFHFEIRGLWDLTRAARIEGYEQSERYQLGMALEAHCARHADRVYVISNALRAQVLEWGVEPDRLHVLPNCVNADTIARALAAGPSVRSHPELTLGYAGSVLHYEGLSLLVDAIARLAQERITVRARIVGDGAELPALRDHVQALNLQEQVELLGPLPPADARRVLAATDAVALPRLPLPVCHVVPPIKLVEAMAMGKPVVVPDLPAFTDEVDDGRTGLVFKAGDAGELAAALRRLAIDASRGSALGIAAREYVGSNRTWHYFATEIHGHLRIAAAAQSLRKVRGTVAAPKATAKPVDRDATDMTALLGNFQAHGATALIQAIRSDSRLGDDRARATRLLQVGRALKDTGHPAAEYELAEEARRIDRSDATLRGYFWAAQRAGRFEEAFQAAQDIIALYGPNPNDRQRAFVERLRSSPIMIMETIGETASNRPQAYVATPARMCYVLHNTLPYSSGGYATRSHGVVSGLRDNGWDVLVLSRPGFPIDAKPDLVEADIPLVDIIDDVRYVRTLAPRRRAGLPSSAYVSAAAAAIEEKLRDLKPALVMAASNYITALPALIAARRVGIPFVYEIRGFWEITRLSREAEYEQNANFQFSRMMEALVAKRADHVFTLTEPMRLELIERGVVGEHVDLLPNSCDAKRFHATERDQTLAAKLNLPPGIPVIGYIGTFVDYEGLEDLAAACDLLRKRGIEFRLMLVGNENTSGSDRGPITQQIIDIAERADFGDWLVMPGRIPHEEVESYYSLIDIAPFPRKPWPVCEMVSPMKPLEALAMEKAVVVSSVKALVEMIRNEETGLVFTKGDPESLADTLQRLIADAPLRARLGKAGRQWVEAERTWTQIGARFGSTLATKHPNLTRALPPSAASEADPKPPWWSQVDVEFRSKCRYVDVTRWTLGAGAQELREEYLRRFGAETVDQRIPWSNWARADICVQTVDPSASLLDVGSGLGEFVNLAAMSGRHGRITSVDLRDWNLWFDHTKSLTRVYRSILELDESLAHDVVTCFEVIEHLQPDQVEAAVKKLRLVAQRKLFVSVPFMEPLPLYRGHFTRFDADNLNRLFPEARFTVFGKGGKDKVMAWVLCEIDTTRHPPPA